MKVLITPEEMFDLNQSDSKLSDLKCCVFDYSEDDNHDFQMIHITQYSSYRYPTIELCIDNKYYLELPANWNIMTTHPEEHVCQMTSFDELLHQQIYVPMLNPYCPSNAHIVPVEITKINPSYVEHFCPRIPKKNILVLPLGNSAKDGFFTYKNIKTQEKHWYPYCILAWDNADSCKCCLGYDNDLLGEF